MLTAVFQPQPFLYVHRTVPVPVSSHDMRTLIGLPHLGHFPSKLFNPASEIIQTPLFIRLMRDRYRKIFQIRKFFSGHSHSFFARAFNDIGIFVRLVRAMRTLEADIIAYDL